MSLTHYFILRQNHPRDKKVEHMWENWFFLKEGIETGWPLKIPPVMGFCDIIIALFEEIVTGLHTTVHDLGMLLLV